jgi:hypothetical protein
MSDEQIPPQKKPLKPGKGYGIIALLCAFGPVMVLGYDFFVVPHVRYLTSPWFETAIFLSHFSILCAIVGIVFGILGHKTEGWLYAGIGRFICLLWCSYVLMINIMFFLIN